METLNDKIENLNKFFNFVEERDKRLIINYYKYNRYDKVNIKN